MDITGDVIYKRKRENQNDFTPQQAIKTITKEYTKAVTKLKLSEDKILGVGVSVPGILDIVSKKIILAPNLGWSMVELLEPLKSSLDIPVYLDNESMCSASCENWLGFAKMLKILSVLISNRVLIGIISSRKSISWHFR